MTYNKKHLSFEEQAYLLIKRGLIADKDTLINRLRNVNYYRLSGYLYPFKQSDDTFKPNTTLETVWNNYTFDRRLRLIIMDAIERFEISFRTQLLYNLSSKTGSFGYMEKINYPNLGNDKYDFFRNKIEEEVKRSKKEVFVKHYYEKYGNDSNSIPIWMFGEIMSFGCALTMYGGVQNSIKKDIAKYYDVIDEIMTSWLQTMNVIRNMCAHHSRLWNREFGVKPLIPRKQKHPQWHVPVVIPNNRVFGVLTILHYLLKKIAPQSEWRSRLYSLLDEYPEISRLSMGFPENWKESPLWE